MGGNIEGNIAGARLLCCGLGFCAEALSRELVRAGWQVAATSRGARSADGIEFFTFGDEAALRGATHLLVSAPPGEEGDPVLAAYGDKLAHLRWIGYLSTTGVYGDHGGGWVDEETPLVPASARGKRRQLAETQWLAFGHNHAIPTQIFRLAGIYGPGRNVLDDIRAGTAQCIERPGQLFGRIHVDDITQVLRAAIAGRSDLEIFNVCDDLPAASAEVIRYGCELLGVEAPPPVSFETAKMSEMQRSFWSDNKRVRNNRIKDALGVTLLYPTYREGLESLTNPSAGS